MKYVLPTVVVLLPLVAFLIAGAIELQSGRRPAGKTLSLVPVLLGILVYGLSWGPVFLPHFPELRFGNWLTFSSAVVACSGPVIPYSRRSSSALVAFGGLELVFIGIFFARAIA